jgi:glucuronate isomerase
MTHPLVLHPDRLFPADSGVRAIARALYGHVRKLPIISPHGHTDPAWWFHDSSEGLRRFREQTTETAGFYNTVGFNDDTRAFLSIPARHDVARRIDVAFLAGLVADHRLDEDEAVQVAVDLTVGLVRKAYKLG